MPSFAIPANYRNVDPHRVVVGAGETALPAVTTAILRAPAKVFVQALSTNSESVFIGPTGVLPTGDGAVCELTPGSSTWIPNQYLSKWKMISASGGQNVLVSYYAGVC